MYYSSIGIIALLIHFIINYDVLKIKTGEELPAQRIYRGFLIAVMELFTAFAWPQSALLKLNSIL